MAERGALPDSTQLLERDREFDQLASALRSARDRHGMVALVSGEAGIGKTTLVRRFLRTLPGDIRALAGSCEDLIAARVLGPFREMLPGTPMGNADAAADLLIAQAERAAGGALVAVVDDVQWADDASLDVIRYIGRRIGTLSLLLVVIFRTEQEPENARLRRVLGALSGHSTLRLELAGLSDDAVRAWSEDAGVAWERVAGLGGNPFLVSEVLAARGADLPERVRDAIVGRVCALPDDVRDLMATLAICPRSIELSILADLHPRYARQLATGERAGLCEVRRGAASYRHEIARRAVEWSLTETERTVRHGRVLAALREHHVDPSRMLHHAVNAGDADAIASIAPIAAGLAADAEAHSEALTASLAALDVADRLTPASVAELLSLAARAAFRLDRAAEAWEHVCAAERVAAAAELDDATQAGILMDKARYAGVLGDADAVAECSRAVIARYHGALAAPVARAHETLANLAVLAGESERAIREARTAERIASSLGDTAAAARAAVPLGIAYATTGQVGDGTRILLQARQALRDARDADNEARAVTNLAIVALAADDAVTAREWFEEAAALGSRREHAAVGYFAAAHLAHLDILEGRWDAADAALSALVSQTQDAPPMRALPEAFLGRLLIRRGDERGRAMLEEAVGFAQRSGMIRRVLFCAVPLLELAWLDDDPERGEHWGWLSIDLARTCNSRFALRDAAGWLRRLGLDALVPSDAFDGARRTGARPFDDALTLVDRTDGSAARGVRELDAIGADATAGRVRAWLRARGETRIPRRGAQRFGPLTRRQREILELVAGGRHTSDIAAHLHLSPRTVDNHIAAAMERLDVTSRTEAAALTAALRSTRRSGRSE